MQSFIQSDFELTLHYAHARTTPMQVPNFRADKKCSEVLCRIFEPDDSNLNFRRLPLLEYHDSDKPYT
jgi:hypothetical protein